jgi:hypothetical protein
LESHVKITRHYELGLASVTVPLSLVSFLAGMAARPPASLPYDDEADFSADGVEVEVDAVVVLPWASVVLVLLVCSVGAGVDDGCGAGVEVPDVPLAVGAGLCD